MAASLSNLLARLKRFRKPPRSNCRHRRLRPPLRIEPLEDRILLATVNWISDSDGFWDIGANWDTGMAPEAGDDVLINRPAADITVTYRTGTASINSLFSTEAFTLTGGILDIAATAQVDNTFRLNGGTLASATVLPGTDNRLNPASRKC